MKLRLITYPNPLLAQKSKKISIIDESIKKLAADMAETLDSYGDSHETGVAIAAIQVGVPIRMTVLKIDDEFVPLINPEIVKGNKEYFEDMEGCMSVPRKYGKVKRFAKVKVRGLDSNGKKMEIKAEGMMARVLQHEIDHMNGKLFLSHCKEDELYHLDNEGKLVR